eukprot:gene26851-35543_t
MNKSFQAVVAFYKPAPPQLSHQHTVMRLYRKSLRTIISWSESREVFNEEATELRARFDANMNFAPDSARTARIMREAFEELHAQRHPDPYIVPYMPGGTLFMRNPAIPLEALYPDGIPKHLSRRRLNIDMSNIPDDQEYADQVFVDSANKTYWISK